MGGTAPADVCTGTPCHTVRSERKALPAQGAGGTFGAHREESSALMPYQTMERKKKREPAAVHCSDCQLEARGGGKPFAGASRTGPYYDPVLEVLAGVEQLRNTSSTGS